METIYEQDFRSCSYGYRPRIGATNAIEDLHQELRDGRYHYIVEADIKGYFDNIDHEIQLDMLNQRIDDKSFTSAGKRKFRYHFSHELKLMA